MAGGDQNEGVFPIKLPWLIVLYGLTPLLDLDVAGRRQRCPQPDQRAPLSGTGGDGPQAAVEAMARGADGFRVDLSLSLSFHFYFIGRAHETVTWFVFL
jgi:hypothetical protein